MGGPCIFKRSGAYSTRTLKFLLKPALFKYFDAFVCLGTLVGAKLSIDFTIAKL
jgi:hypothetical protein